MTKRFFLICLALCPLYSFVSMANELSPKLYPFVTPVEVYGFGEQYLVPRGPYEDTGSRENTLTNPRYYLREKEYVDKTFLYDYYEIEIIDRYHLRKDNPPTIRVSVRVWNKWKEDPLVVRKLLSRLTKDFSSLNAISLYERCPSIVLPKQRPKGVGKDMIPFWDWKSSISPYQMMMSGIDKITKKSPAKCRKALRNLSEEVLKFSSYRGMSIKDRASEILMTSRKTIEEVRRESAKYNNKATGHDYKDYINPYYIHRLVSPEMMTCFAMMETGGSAKLNPLSANYTYCGDNSSTAFGWLQATNKTINGMINNSSGNLMPWLSYQSSHLKDIRDKKKIQDELSLEPELQMEAMLYIINEKMKFKYKEARRKGKNLSDRELIIETIGYYDQDNSGPYLEKVLSCMNCLTKTGGDPYGCYKKMFK